MIVLGMLPAAARHAACPDLQDPFPEVSVGPALKISVPAQPGFRVSRTRSTSEHDAGTPATPRT